MNRPDSYKLMSVGRLLQRKGLEQSKVAEEITGEHALSTKAMTLADAGNLKEVGDWLVAEGDPYSDKDEITLPQLLLHWQSVVEDTGPFTKTTNKLHESLGYYSKIVPNIKVPKPGDYDKNETR